MAVRKFQRDLRKETLWRERVREQLASGLKVRSYCLREQISEPSFYAWRKELAKRDGVHDGEPATTAQATVTEAAALPSFTEVVVTPPTVSSAIELVLGNSRRILVSPGFDAATLQAVVEMLEWPRC
jgi:transposase-like protein